MAADVAETYDTDGSCVCPPGGYSLDCPYSRPNEKGEATPHIKSCPKSNKPCTCRDQCFILQYERRLEAR